MIKQKKSLIAYLENARPLLLKNDDEQHVFLNNQGTGITSRGIETVMQKKLLIRQELVVKYTHMSCDIALLPRCLIMEQICEVSKSY